MTALMIHANAAFLIPLAVASIGLLAIALIVERFARRLSAASRHTILLAAMLMPPALIAAAAVFPRSEPSPPLPAGGSVLMTRAAARPVSAPVDIPKVLAAVWMIGVLVSLLRSARSALHWRSVARFADVKEGFAVSHECGEPMVIGILKPTIVLPAGAYIESLTPSELEAVFAHEQAHIARRDNLVALLIQLTCAFFWFDPLHRSARRRLVALRERACDEAVLERGCNADSYLSALARSCEVPFHSSAVACMSRLQLRERMELIMTYESHRRFPTRIVRVLLVASIVMAAVAFAVFAPSPILTAGEVDSSAAANVADFSVYVMRSQKMPYIVGIKSGFFTGVTEFASAPDVRSMSTTVGNRTYTWAIQLNSDGSGTANLEVTEGASLLATSVRTFGAPSAMPPIPPPPPRPGVKRLDGTMTPPVVISRVEPMYPEEARSNRIAGIVIVEMTINEDGSVSDARVVKPLPFGLDQAALEAVRQWRWEPATAEGKPVPVRFNITINFKLDGSEKK